jgi:hypothetical protein
MKVEDIKLAFEKNQKFELNLISDFEKLATNHFSLSGKFEQKVQKIESGIKEMQTAFIDLQKSASDIDSQYQKARKSAMDLGVDIPVSVENDYKKTIALLKNDLSTFNKYNK